MGKFFDRLKAAVGWVGNRITEVVYDKAGPQGAAELGSALNSQSNAYVPYGVGQAPLEVEGPQTSYQATLRDASRGAGQEQDRGMDR